MTVECRSLFGLSWKQRDASRWVVIARPERWRCGDPELKDFADSERKVPDVAFALACKVHAACPADSIVYIESLPPKHECWWESRREPRRLPIYGEGAIDQVVRVISDDCNFGAWLFQSRKLDGWVAHLWELCDHSQTPEGMSVNEIDSVVARGDGDEFFDPDDETMLICMAEDDEDSEQCARAREEASRRLIGDVVDSPGDATEAYLSRRRAWIRSELRRRGATGAFSEAHACAATFEPILPPQSGGVYVIQGVGDYVKIGKAKNIASRLREIQLAHPVPLRLLAILSEDPSDEGKFHKRFASLRASGEWFRFGTELRFLVKESRAGRARVA